MRILSGLLLFYGIRADAATLSSMMRWALMHCASSIPHVQPKELDHASR